jgi:hypothetical protein
MFDNYVASLVLGGIILVQHFIIRKLKTEINQRDRNLFNQNFNSERGDFYGNDL